jgi:hypothetical protein
LLLFIVIFELIIAFRHRECTYEIADENTELRMAANYGYVVHIFGFKLVRFGKRFTYSKLVCQK